MESERSGSFWIACTSLGVNCITDRWFYFSSAPATNPFTYFKCLRCMYPILYIYKYYNVSISVVHVLSLSRRVARDNPFLTDIIPVRSTSQAEKSRSDSGYSDTNWQISNLVLDKFLSSFQITCDFHTL